MIAPVVGAIPGPAASVPACLLSGLHPAVVLEDSYRPWSGPWQAKNVVPVAARTAAAGWPRQVHGVLMKAALVVRVWMCPSVAVTKNVSAPFTRATAGPAVIVPAPPRLRHLEVNCGMSEKGEVAGG